MIVKVGGPVTDITTAASNVVAAIPALTDGNTTRWVHCETEGATITFVRLGVVGAVMTGEGQGTMVTRNGGPKVFTVQSATHIHTWSSAAGRLIVTPLSGDPRS